MITVLAIDGGGIRGIIPATYLDEIEKRCQKSVSRLFDIIAGTSTGGILAAGLTVPDASGRPRYSAADLRETYLSSAGALFPRSALRSLSTLGGLTGPIYSPKPLERMLNAYFGEVRLSETLTEILVTAYDMASSTPWFFKTSFARQNPAPVDNPLLSQVVRATSAAPTYFPPLNMDGLCLVDGAVFASNPALCAYAQACRMFPGEHEILVVSLGTGLQNHDRSAWEVSHWGIMDWAVPISTVMMNSSSATVNYQMQALAGEENYVRFQVNLDKGAGRMDDADNKNLRYLDSLSRTAVTADAPLLDKLCRRLTHRGTPPGRAIRYP